MSGYYKSERPDAAPEGSLHPVGRLQQASGQAPRFLLGLSLGFRV